MEKNLTHMKYIICTGSTPMLQDGASVPSRIGDALHKKGYRTTYVRLDVHLNHDSRNVSLKDKGEVFVLNDGNETDLSLGVYERWCDVVLTGDNHLTLGKMLTSIVEEERNSNAPTKPLDLDKSVSKYVKKHITRLSSTPVLYRDGQESVPDFMIIDVGTAFTARGTGPELIASAVRSLVSTMNSSSYSILYSHYFDNLVISKFNKSAISAQLKQKRFNFGCDVISLLVSGNYGQCYISKPSHASCRRSVASAMPVYSGTRIFGFTASFIASSFDTPQLDTVPALGDKMDSPISQCEEVDLQSGSNSSRQNPSSSNSQNAIEIAIIAELPKASNPYLALEDSLIFAGMQLNSAVHVRYIYLRDLERSGNDVAHALSKINGILMPGGFGSQFLAQKLKVIEYARTNSIPYLGICLGFQLAIIEFARNVVGISDATSEEFDPATSSPVIHKLPSVICDNTQLDIYLGAYSTNYTSNGAGIYKEPSYSQRYRHRYALKNSYLESLETKGMLFFAKTTHNRTVAFRLNTHPFFVGVQYHPELGSTHSSIDPVIVKFVSSTVTVHNTSKPKMAV